MPSIALLAMMVHLLAAAAHTYTVEEACESSEASRKSTCETFGHRSNGNRCCQWMGDFLGCAPDVDDPNTETCISYADDNAAANQAPWTATLHPGMNSCPSGEQRIATPEDCMIAGTKMGMVYIGSGSYDFYPKGCFVANGISVMYNNHPSGSPHDGDRGAVICKQATTSGCTDGNCETCLEADVNHCITCNTGYSKLNGMCQANPCEACLSKNMVSGQTCVLADDGTCSTPDGRAYCTNAMHEFPISSCQATIMATAVGTDGKMSRAATSVTVPCIGIGSGAMLLFVALAFSKKRVRVPEQPLLG